MTNPEGDMRPWELAQLKGGIAPEIMHTPAEWANEDAKYGWFVNLNPYLARPNPYHPGNKRWYDDFRADMTDRNRSADGHLYSLPFDLVSTGIFYNKDIFRKLHLKVPQTWEQFLDVQAKIKKSGYIPFLFPGGLEVLWQWVHMCFLDQLYNDQFAKMDVDKWRISSMGWVDPQEFVRAYELGIFKLDDPRYRTMLRLIKQWSQYWQSGFYSTNEYTLFHIGKAAMMWMGSWEATQLDLDKERKFDFGVFPLPYFTTKTSPYATAGVARGIGGASSLSIAIPSTVRDAGKLDITIDFLRYATAPQNLGPLVSEAEMFVPNCKGAKVSPLLKPFQDALKNGTLRFAGEMTTAEYTYQWERILQNYLGGLYSEDKTIKTMSYYLELSVKQQLESNHDQWRWGRNWEILPSNTSYDQTAKVINPAEGPVFFKFIVAIAVLPVLAGILLLFRGWKETRAAGKKSWCYLFLLPTFTMLVLFCYYPAFSAFYHSLYEWQGGGQTIWTGLGNFRALFSDKILQDGCANMLKLLAVGLCTGLTIPLLVAELIFRLGKDRARYIYRVLFVVPMVVPVIVTLLIWRFMYDPDLGVLNHLLAAVGLGGLRHAWLSDPKLALWSLAAIGFPWGRRVRASNLLRRASEHIHFGIRGGPT